MTLSPYTTLAKTLALQAGRISLKAFTSQSFTVSTKPDNTLVTEIDQQIETLWRQQITTHFPDHSIYGEEQGRDDKNSDYVWYLDPLDGTTNFTHGIPIFCHMIALAHNGQTISSVINFPLTKQLFWAHQGRGAYVNDHRLRAVDPPQPNQLAIHIDSGGTAESKKKLGHLHQKIAGHFRTDRRMGSIAASLLPLAAHQPTAYFVTNTSPHDIIPAALIYQEAGLVLLNLNGKPWNTTDDTLIACPSSVKNYLLKLSLSNKYSCWIRFFQPLPSIP